jgi:hypothetical protein
MVYSILHGMLGPFSAVLDFFAARTEYITAFFCLYLGMYAIGQVQLTGIKKLTKKIIDENLQNWAKSHPNASNEQLFSYFFPIWADEIQKTGYKYILNKYDFLPVAITPEHVMLKIHLTPDYLRKYLSGTKIAEIETRERVGAVASKKKK